MSIADLIAQARSRAVVSTDSHDTYNLLHAIASALERAEQFSEAANVCLRAYEKSLQRTEQDALQYKELRQNAELTERLQAPLPEEVRAAIERLHRGPWADTEAALLVERLARDAQNVRREALEEAARICDEATERFTKSAAQALKDGNVLLGHRQLVSELLACQIRDRKFSQSAGQESSREARSGPAGGKGNPDPVHDDQSAGREVNSGEAVVEHVQNDRPVAASGTRISTVGTASENSRVTEITAPAPAIQNAALRGLDGPSDNEVGAARDAQREKHLSQREIILMHAVLRWHEGRKS